MNSSCSTADRVKCDLRSGLTEVDCHGSLYFPWLHEALSPFAVLLQRQVHNPVVVLHLPAFLLFS